MTTSKDYANCKLYSTGDFRFEYEYEVKYEYNFLILVCWFHIIKSYTHFSHDLPSLPKTNIAMALETSLV